MEKVRGDSGGHSDNNSTLQVFAFLVFSRDYMLYVAEVEEEWTINR